MCGYEASCAKRKGGGGGGGGGQLQLKTSPRINSLRSTFFLSLNAGVVRVSTQCTSFKGMAQPLRMMHEFKYQVNGNDQPLWNETKCCDVTSAKNKSLLGTRPRFLGRAFRQTDNRECLDTTWRGPTATGMDRKVAAAESSQWQAAAVSDVWGADESVQGCSARRLHRREKVRHKRPWLRRLSAATSSSPFNQ